MLQKVVKDRFAYAYAWQDNGFSFCALDSLLINTRASCILKFLEIFGGMRERLVPCVESARSSRKKFGTRAKKIKVSRNLTRSETPATKAI